jgi:hypothetical protein
VWCVDRNARRQFVRRMDRTAPSLAFEKRLVYITLSHNKFTHTWDVGGIANNAARGWSKSQAESVESEGRRSKIVAHSFISIGSGNGGG